MVVLLKKKILTLQKGQKLNLVISYPFTVLSVVRSND